MATNAQGQTKARALRVAVQFNRDGGTPFRLGSDCFHEIVLTAPHGFRFSATDTHEIVVTGEANAPMTQLADSALRELADGLTACDDETCDWCHEGTEGN